MNMKRQQNEYEQLVKEQKSMYSFFLKALYQFPLLPMIRLLEMIERRFERNIEPSSSFNDLRDYMNLMKKESGNTI